MITKDINLIWI